MTVNILVREALPADANGVLVALQSVFGEPDHNLSITAAEFSMTEPDEIVFIEQMSSNEDSLMLVAEDLVHGEIVGVLTCEGETRAARRHAVTLGISVVKGWRGKGVGRKLMTEAIGWANRHPVICRIELKVMVRNMIAVALYKKLGFVVEGTARGAVCKDGEFHDSHYMALTL